MNIKKILKWISISILILVACTYLFFIISLRLTASGIGFSKEVQEAVYAKSTTPHQIKLIDNGSLSLYERLKLIESANKSIELEFFIYNLDRASRLFTNALVKKAKNGVKIRLLVDFSAAVFQLRPSYAKLMEEAGIQIKYYNTSSLYRLFTVQHRSHRKLLIVDSEQALTGGRNIGDEYFDLSDHYNFLDTDILVSGPIVKAIQSSFDLYWSSDFSVEPKKIDDDISPVDLEKALSYLKLTPDDQDALEKIKSFGINNSELSPQTICKDLIFVTDFPGLGESHRKLYTTILDVISEAKNEISIESPYFVLREEGYNAFKELDQKHLKVSVLTNSLYSTDAFYIVASLWKNLDWIAKLGLDLSVYDGEVLKQAPMAIEKTSARWGVHSKRAVVDKRTVLVGTYNIDPRSANLNSELMLVCKNNPEFAQQVLQSIQHRLSQSKKIMSEGKVINADALTEKTTLKQKILTWLSVPIATSFDFIL